MNECVEIKFFKVTALPTIGEPDSIYLLLSGSTVQQYVTDKFGNFISSPGFLETLTVLRKSGNDIIYKDENGVEKSITFSSVAFTGIFSDVTGVPTNTSDLVNDGEGTSPFATIDMIPINVSDLNIDVAIGTTLSFDPGFPHILRLLDQGSNLISSVSFGTDNISNLNLYTGFDSRYYTKVEIDSFFSGSTLISGYNKANWDEAYSWGNHAEAGYLTSIGAETDPIFTASPAAGITAGDISNWNSIDLQDAYNNSVIPRIVTSALGAFTLQESISDSNNILVIKNISGVNKFSVTSFGEVTAESFTKIGGLGTQFLKADGSIDSNVYVNTTNNQTIGGTKTFSSDILIPDEAYGISWDGSLEAPTKNAIYDKIESLVLGGGGVNVSGTPVDNQLAVWVDANTIEGTAGLSFNGTILSVLGNTVWHSGNDGGGSGLDSDLLDGIQASAFLRSDVADQKTSGTLTFNDNVILGFGTSSGESTLRSTGTNTVWDFSSGVLNIQNLGVTKFTLTPTTGNLDVVGQITTTGNEVEIQGNSPKIDFLETSGTNNWNILVDNNVFYIRENGTLNTRFNINEGGIIEIQSLSGLGDGIVRVDNNGALSHLDYAEGTFTPSITASSGTYSSIIGSGSYVKIGKLVFFQLSINASTGSASGATTLTGLPFSCGSVQGNCVVELVAEGPNFYSVIGRVTIFGTTVALLFQPTLDGNNSNSGLVTGTGFQIHVTGSYITA